MSCHGCAEAFGFWRRELGCPTCGFSYCKKCLRFKLEAGGTTQTVCSKCFTSNKTPSPDDPKNPGSSDWKTASQALRAIQVLEAMDNPAKPPITLYRESSNSRLANLKKGLSVDDQRLVERLEELSDVSRTNRRKSDQPDEDLAARLAKLKDEEVPQEGPHTRDGKSFLLTQKPETELELMERLSKQVELQKNYETSVVDDIEARLAKLKGEPLGSPSGSGSQPSAEQGTSAMDQDEEVGEKDQVEQIIARYVAEAALESSKSKDGDDDDGSPPLSPDDGVGEYESDESDSDLDYDKLCRICEEKRAILVCEECDGDIFCKNCFKEFHDELGESHEPARISRSAEKEL